MVPLAFRMTNPDDWKHRDAQRLLAPTTHAFFFVDKLEFRIVRSLQLQTNLFPGGCFRSCNRFFFPLLSVRSLEIRHDRDRLRDSEKNRSSNHAKDTQKPIFFPISLGVD